MCGLVWMAANIKVTHYSNGEAIPEVDGDADWGHAISGASCRDPDKTSENITSGRLYNWKAAADIRGLCPKGWHVPTFQEWTSMITCFGGESQAGKRLTEDIPEGPGMPSKEYLYESPFSLPCGFRYSNGEYSSGKALTCQWWSATQQDSISAKALQLGCQNSDIFFTGSDKRSGLSVRCLKDQ